MSGEFEILLLRPDEVRVDKDNGVQRELRLAKARAMAKDYSPTLFGCGYVSARDDGYYVLDAQHRCAASIMAGMGHVPVPFFILRGLSIAEEAAWFEKLNKNITPVSAFDRFNVGVTAGYPSNVDIVRILQTFGLTYGVKHRDGVVSAVDTLVQIYEMRIPGTGRKKNGSTGLPQGHLLSRTLQVLTKAWGIERNAFDGMLMRAVAGAINKHDVRIEGNRLASNLAKADTPARAVGKIKAIREASRVTIVAAGIQYIEGVYNRYLSEDKKLS